MKRVTILLAVLLTATAISGAPAQFNVIRVPSEYPTIQQALLAAPPGWTVLVASGTYVENIFWPRTADIRLLAQEGPDRTTIDGGGVGRVVQFPPGLGPDTVLQGFTLTNGLDRDGAGVRVFSSPTIRNCHIVWNRAVDPTDNHGGGVTLTGGGTPRLERNLIQGNRCMGGLRAAGGGVYVTGGAAPTLVSNQILGNTCQGVLTAEGGGVYVDGAAAAGVVLVGNVIAGNLCSSSSACEGGGVSVAGGPASMLHNTVALNSLSGSGTLKGGGIYFGPNASNGSRLVNSIVVYNSAAGIHVDAGYPTLDYNDVWQNLGTNYQGIQAGPHDRSVDPGFGSFGDYHLAASSLLVDAGINLPEAAREGPDVDGDPRFVDGNQDGLAGNAARADIGADEFAVARIQGYSAAWAGSHVAYKVDGLVGRDYYLYWSTTKAGVLVQPFGQLLIGPVLYPLGSGATPGYCQARVPNSAFLAGLTVHVQGLVVKPGSGSPLGSFTNRVEVLLLDPVQGLFENFLDQKQMDPQTTARWAYGNQPGLQGILGYGGNGADGNLDLTGFITLDSGTRQPGADGVVEWSYQSLRVRAGAGIKLKGPYPIRIRVQQSCLIEGSLDASGAAGASAPAGLASQVGSIPGGAGGPGAGAGGSANVDPNHPIGALPMALRGGPGYPRASTCADVNRSDNRLITVIEPNCGGGTGGNRGVPSGTLFRDGCSGNGGGHMQDGIQTDYLCSNIGAFGREFGVKWVANSSYPNAVAAPTGGTGGGAGGNAAISTTNPSPANDIVAGAGGGGGGGLEIECAHTIDVKGTGRILAPGGNGGMGYSSLVSGTTVSGGWGAGGSGGSLWLSATAVVLDPQTTLDARGGIGNPVPPSPTRSGDGGLGYIIVRDRGGNPTIPTGAPIAPPPEPARLLFDPPNQGISTAISKFYDSGVANPRWSFASSNPQTGEVIPGGDLVFVNPPLSGQRVFIKFQGAPDLNGQPDPNPANWYPQGVFTPDIELIRARGNLRHIRFQIDFDLGKQQKGQPPLNLVTINSVTMHF